MQSILLRNLRIFAHHGVMPQETVVGCWFTINLRLTTDFTQALLTDDLTGTVSYADVLQVVREEMNIPSKLLEHAGGRIVRELFRQFPSVTHINLQLMKQNPPMGADIESAGIEIDTDRPLK